MRTKPLWSEIQLGHVSLKIPGLCVNKIRQYQLRIFLMHEIECPHVKTLHYKPLIKML